MDEAAPGEAPRSFHHVEPRVPSGGVIYEPNLSVATYLASFWSFFSGIFFDTIADGKTRNVYGCFQKIGLPPKWMVKIMENPIKMG